MNDPLDTTRWCRDESCPRDDLHLAHPPLALRGRTPKACPQCLGSLLRPAGGTMGTCPRCGWSRDGLSARHYPPSASPWVECPMCRGTECEACAFTGFMPRVRAVRLRGDVRPAL